MNIKTQKEIEEKYEELNKRMADNMPTKESNQKMKDVLDSGKLDPSIMQDEMNRSVESYHIDGMRYILEWVMGHHD